MPEQLSPEWFAARLGKVTASRIPDLLAKTKTGWGASRANYAAQLIAERLTGQPQESYGNAAMQWGIENEGYAKTAYEFHRDQEVLPVFFLDHPRIKMAGASPDGLVGELGLCEIKCPQTATHIETLINRVIPTKYINQMQFQMACAERDWCDFVSFDPRMPEHMRLFVARINRDNKTIEQMEKDVAEFLDELETRVSKLTELYQRKEAA